MTKLDDVLAEETNNVINTLTGKGKALSEEETGRARAVGLIGSAIGVGALTGGIGAGAIAGTAGAAGTASAAGATAGGLSVGAAYLLGALTGVFGTEIKEAFLGFTETGEGRISTLLAAYSAADPNETVTLNGNQINVKETLRKEAIKSMSASGYTKELQAVNLKNADDKSPFAIAEEKTKKEKLQAETELISSSTPEQRGAFKSEFPLETTGKTEAETAQLVINKRLEGEKRRAELQAQSEKAQQANVGAFASRDEFLEFIRKTYGEVTPTQAFFFKHPELQAENERTRGMITETEKARFKSEQELKAEEERRKKRKF